MTVRKITIEQSGSTLPEFALVLPLLMILLFGIIDAGRWMWTYNQAEKATQMGARMAVVTDYASSAIGNSFLGSCSPALTQGDVIPASCFSTITCTSSSCSSGTLNTTAFNNVVTRMKYFLPQLTASNVVIEYRPSGLGYAGSPVLPDLSPLVTVRITGMQFRPLTTFDFGNIGMPSFATTLSAEDLSGQYSN